MNVTVLYVLAAIGAVVVVLGGAAIFLLVLGAFDNRPLFDESGRELHEQESANRKGAK